MGSLVLQLSPCWQWIPLHTKCNEALSVGSANPHSMWTRQMPDKYTFNVCWQWIPLHTKCNEALSVGSANPHSMWTRQMPDKYTFNVL